MVMRKIAKIDLIGSTQSTLPISNCKSYLFLVQSVEVIFPPLTLRLSACKLQITGSN